MGNDAAGDVTNDGTNTYLYNADGQRVAKGTITSMSCDPTVNGFTTQSDYVRDQSGNQLSEFTVANGSPQWVHTNVYASGELIATDDTNETHFYLNDWLGTRRVMTGPSGVVEQDCMSLPYGDSETCAPPPSGTLFTGKEKDAETAGGVSPFGVNQGNDYFGARYYSSVMGRWLSPDYSDDPEAVPYADLENPQSLNLYDYIDNNPISRFDDNGHSQDTYVADIDKHGGPHIDRYRGNQNVGCYNPDGSSIDFKGKPSPPVPNSDKGKFEQAKNKLEKKIKQREKANAASSRLVDAQLQSITTTAHVVFSLVHGYYDFEEWLNNLSLQPPTLPTPPPIKPLEFEPLPPLLFFSPMPANGSIPGGPGSPSNCSIQNSCT